MTDHDEDVFEQRLDAGVSELRGRCTPPDVTAAVMSRLDEEPDSAGSRPEVGRPRSTGVLLAACVLLGLGAVVATFWMARAESAPDARLRELRQDPERVALRDLPSVVVASMTELAELRQDTLAVELRGLGHDAVDALREHAPYVQKLLLRGDAVESAAVFRALWLDELQLLDLAGCTNVEPNVIAELAQDPRLLQVVFDGQDWLAEEHLLALAKAGIEPVLPAQHPLVPVLGQVLGDHGERARERHALASPRAIPWVQVRSRAEIEALDAGVIAVDGVDLDDEAVAALVRLPGLAHLCLRAGQQGGKPKVLGREPAFEVETDETNRGSVTDAGLAALAELRDLQTLLLAGTVDVEGDGLRHLVGLPKLRELRIVAQDTSDAGLEFLPGCAALRRLWLETNHGFTSAGMRAVTACRRLEALVLSRCPQLGVDDYARIGGMAGLRELRIRWPAGGAAWRDDDDRQLTETEAEVLAAARTASNADGAPGLDLALPQIVEARALEKLEIALAKAGENLARIGDLPRLRELALLRVEGVTTELVPQLPRGLRVLDLSGNEALDDTVVRRICERFDGLEELGLRALPELKSLAPLETMTTLRRLEVAFCAELGPAAGATLEQCTFLHWVDFSYCRKLPDGLIPHLRERGVAVKQQRW